MGLMNKWFRLLFIIFVIFATFIFSAKTTPVYAQDATPTANFSGTGIDLYGESVPLNQDQVNTLISQLNANPLSMLPDTYYATMFVASDVYKQFIADNSENITAYLARNGNRLSTMLKTANPPVNGGLIIRRLVIVTDSSVVTPASYHNGYITDGIKDSDGTWYFNSVYRPADSAYYNSGEKVDYGLLHEFGHSVLHLNDQYLLDVPRDQLGSILLSVMPTVWQDYYNYYKKGVSDQDLMATVGPKIQDFTARQLNRRKNIHDFSGTIRDYLGWNPEFPASVKVNFYNGTTQINAKTVKVYRRTLSAQTITQISNKKLSHGKAAFEKDFSPINSLSGINGISDIPVKTYSVSKGQGFTLNPQELFMTDSSGLIPDGTATLIWEITDNTGKSYWRWTDVRDLNVASWTSNNNLSEQLSGLYNTPATFNWQISYTSTNIRPPRK